MKYLLLIIFVLKCLCVSAQGNNDNSSWWQKKLEENKSRNHTIHKKDEREVTTNKDKDLTNNIRTEVPTNIKNNINTYSGTEIFKNFSPAVFMILTADSEESVFQGSGFFINDKGLAVTCAHVLKDMEVAAVKVPNKDKFFKITQVLFMDEENDCAVFRIDAVEKPFVRIAQKKPEVGERVFAIGSPKGLENTYCSGEISQWRGPYMIQTTAPIDHGSSGGVLLNAKGEAIGVCKGGITSQASLNFACSIDIVRQYLARVSESLYF